MKTPQFVMCGLGAALLVLNQGVATSCAQSFDVVEFLPTERLNIKLTALIQGESVDVQQDGESIGTRDMPPQRVRIDNKALLQLYGAPVGSRLVLMDGESIGYQTGSSDPVNTGITFSMEDPFVAITKGQETEVSGDTKSVSKANYIAQYVANPHVEIFNDVPANPFNIVGFSFSLVGMAKETVNNKTTETDTNSSASFHHSFIFSGVGNGTIITSTNFPASSESKDVVVSGQISTVGKSTGLVE